MMNSNKVLREFLLNIQVTSVDKCIFYCKLVLIIPYPPYICP